MAIRPVDDVAPYPHRSEDATADALARHAAAFAQLHVGRRWQLADADCGPQDSEYRLSLHITVNNYAVAHLLRALQAYAPDRADEVARDLWSAWEDGGVCEELIWDWLEEYGVDPKPIRDSGKASVAREGQAGG